eukprot:jgi/Hompol1/4223/HPOL_006989-RA
MDVESGDLLDRKTTHSGPITHIIRHHFTLYTLDETGGLKIWSANRDGDVLLSSTPRALRISPRQSHVIIDRNHLWAASGKRLEIINLSLDAPALVERRVDVSFSVGQISALASLPAKCEIYVGHEDGKISVFNALTFEKKRTYQVAFYRVSSLLGVNESHLWAGFGTGKISIFDVDYNNGDSWSLVKEFLPQSPQNSPVVGLYVDDTSLLTLGQLYIASVLESGIVRIWDGLLTDFRIDSLMHSYERQFCDYQQRNVVVLTWNIDSRKPSDIDAGDLEDRTFLSSVIQGNDDADVFVFGFQELIDL